MRAVGCVNKKLCRTFVSAILLETYTAGQRLNTNYNLASQFRFSSSGKPNVSESIEFQKQPTISTETSSILSGFVSREIGSSIENLKLMLNDLGYDSLDNLMKDIIPVSVRRTVEMKEIPALAEQEAFANLVNLMGRNKVLKSLIGHGYYESIIPAALIRHFFENPNWYTPYTPYQAEISQGRLEALLNFQTMICSLTGMELANASMLDMATAASEAVSLAFHHTKDNAKKTVLVSNKVFPGVISMIKTRAAPLGIKVVVDDITKEDVLSEGDIFAVVVQSPNAIGEIHDFTEFFSKVRAAGAMAICNTDLLALCLAKPPGEMGADVVVGSAQRFGVPLGYGGPHAAFFASKLEYKRLMPGRIVAVSKDSQGMPALRLALQTREQHIKRQKATSNICTAQALLANMSGFYAVFHGPEGLRNIALQVHDKAKILAIGLLAVEQKLVNEQNFFDTITFSPVGMSCADYAARCVEKNINVYVDASSEEVSIAIDEATTDDNIISLLEAAGMENPDLSSLALAVNVSQLRFPQTCHRTTPFLVEEVFNKYHSETAFMRYLGRLVRRDYSLTHGMIPLGSCTMKLNPSAGMLPLTWPVVNNLHPMAPENQCRGYEQMFIDFENWMKEITGFAAVSLQPNSGAQGEYCGLRTIRAYQQSIGSGDRDICLIPESAHGTNAASSAMAGMRVVVVKCDREGGIDLVDLQRKINRHQKQLSAIMVTFPSTYGLFDKDMKKVSEMVHAAGGQVYVDGANMNAMIGYSGPAFINGDVCHLNMHKTFGIPHGGGGPGVGVIAAVEHLAPFLPNSWFSRKVGGSNSFGQISQAPYGSASILNISYMLIRMLGTSGLMDASAVACLNANYVRKQLESHYQILYHNDKNLCGHEFIIDIRPFKKATGIEAEDVAKRLMDYGFHSPTLAFPVPGTLMVEPTESEPKEELDRFVQAMIKIREEIQMIQDGKYSCDDNPLKNAPHTAQMLAAAEWTHTYSREVAAFPTKHTKEDKYWPAVGRVDGVAGDKYLLCSCGGFEEVLSGRFDEQVSALSSEE